MWSINRSDSIAANSTNSNILSGTPFEFIPEDSHVTFLQSQSATGLQTTIYINNVLITQNAVPVIKATTPLYPDDIMAEVDAAGGARMVVSITNTTGGALTALTNIRGEDLEE